MNSKTNCPECGDTLIKESNQGITTERCPSTSGLQHYCYTNEPTRHVVNFTDGSKTVYFEYSKSLSQQEYDDTVTHIEAMIAYITS